MLLLHIGSKADDCIDEALILIDTTDTTQAKKALADATDHGVKLPYIIASLHIDDWMDLAGSLAKRRVFVG